MGISNLDVTSLPMVALRGLVVFPKSTLHFDVGRQKSIAAIKSAMVNKQNVFLVTQKDITEDNVDIKSVYEIGTVCEIKQIVRMPSSESLRVVVEGKYRAKLCGITGIKPFFTAAVSTVNEKEPKSIDNIEKEALIRHTKTLFDDYELYATKVAPDVAMNVSSIKNAGELADYIASNIPLDYPVKQDILSQLNVLKRLEKLCIVLANEVDILEIEAVIENRVQEQVDENQRDYYLREQMKAISSELNDGDSPYSESQRYRDRILKLGLAKEDEEKLLTESNRLIKMQSSSPESTVVRNYLDEVLALPWKTYTKDNLNIEKAMKILDKDHYGLKEVKERIVELLAVRQLAPDIKGQIICLAGPPGVGKTSITKSLAKAMNRKYVRISLGGVRDEAEIRGHRRTYIGAMPGSIISSLKQAKSSNPLILLDEIDKLSSDNKGDPSSALLEALDPEQNNSFRDHYIDIPFDLSKALFVTTANDIGNIPAPLRDRMEIIELFSYTFEEKMNIAKKHLIPKLLKEYGLKPSVMKIQDDALKLIIDGYTKEAGVRKLEQVVSKILRKEAVKFAKGFKGKIVVKASDLEELLGVRKYKEDLIDKTDRVGVVNGLAWTSVGGEMLQIEAIAVEGTGKLELTGSLGDVMKESAKAAYSYIRSVAEQYSIKPDFYKTMDVHLHFPEGAVPKDGPSAGIGITTALVSALSGNSVKSSIAMTGEVTLTGRVLAIGGLKEKSMAAYKSGIKTVIIPDENLSDLKEFDKAVIDAIDFIPVTDVSEVLKLCLNIDDNEIEQKELEIEPVIENRKVNSVRIRS